MSKHRWNHESWHKPSSLCILSIAGRAMHTQIHLTNSHWPHSHAALTHTYTYTHTHIHIQTHKSYTYTLIHSLVHRQSLLRAQKVKRKEKREKSTEYWEYCGLRTEYSVQYWSEWRVWLIYRERKEGRHEPISCKHTRRGSSTQAGTEWNGQRRGLQVGQTQRGEREKWLLHPSLFCLFSLCLSLLLSTSHSCDLIAPGHAAPSLRSDARSPSLDSHCSSSLLINSVTGRHTGQPKVAVVPVSLQTNLPWEREWEEKRAKRKREGEKDSA